MENLKEEYWSKRYRDGQTGWDLGQVSRPIKEYIDQLTDKNSRILIPGCGTGHEGEYVYRLGFKNVHVLDFSKYALELFKMNCPYFPDNQIIHDDFFNIRGSYDLIIEQTLFCAIDPSLRSDYAKKAAELLVPGGKLVGLLFDRHFEVGPPFGGDRTEYLELFQPYFSSVQLDPCFNSVEPRKGTELFIRFIK